MGRLVLGRNSRLLLMQRRCAVLSLHRRRGHVVRDRRVTLRLRRIRTVPYRLRLRGHRVDTLWNTPLRLRPCPYVAGRCLVHPCNVLVLLDTCCAC
jgi:hypothetical protein